MKMRVAALMLSSMAVAAAAAAQNVEMVFTPGVSQQAVMLKSALTLDRANVASFGALALVGAPADRKKAYADKVSHNTAVVVVGEDALKAVSEIEFSVPLVAVNASAKCAARGRVIRVFDVDSPAAPAGVLPGQSIASITEALRSGGEVVLKGNATWIVRIVMAALK